MGKDHSVTIYCASVAIDHFSPFLCGIWNIQSVLLLLSWPGQIRHISLSGFIFFIFLSLFFPQVISGLLTSAVWILVRKTGDLFLLVVTSCHCLETSLSAMIISGFFFLIWFIIRTHCRPILRTFRQTEVTRIVSVTDERWACRLSVLTISDL